MKGTGVSFKDRLNREKLKKRSSKGFRGYPVATIAYYGPTNELATKLVVGIVTREHSDPEFMQKWFSETADVRFDPKICSEALEFINAHAPKSVVMFDRIFGCPHESGIDFPEGESCPQCPYWAMHDRFSGEVVH